ncbi:CRISPR-associated protein [Lacticaseibacillus casei DSM 20011 = JCM 1134 = ATCC 393]|nr:CRISPR-associated protein [Lacticaseibacillus casei DSM 20011 = JCM 1134 = ATCC 393]
MFKALSMLRTRADSKTAIDRRVRQALALTNYEAVVNALGSLIGIVKATKLPLKLDYAQLAEDLYWFQMSYEQASRVRLRWGQDYYGTVSANERTEQND